MSFQSAGSSGTSLVAHEPSPPFERRAEVREPERRVVAASVVGDGARVRRAVLGHRLVVALPREAGRADLVEDVVGCRRARQAHLERAARDGQVVREAGMRLAGGVRLEPAVVGEVMRVGRLGRRLPCLHGQVLLHDDDDVRVRPRARRDEAAGTRSSAATARAGRRRDAGCGRQARGVSGSVECVDRVRVGGLGRERRVVERGRRAVHGLDPGAVAEDVVARDADVVMRGVPRHVRRARAGRRRGHVLRHARSARVGRPRREAEVVDVEGRAGRRGRLDDVHGQRVAARLRRVGDGGELLPGGCRGHALLGRPDGRRAAARHLLDLQAHGRPGPVASHRSRQGVGGARDDRLRGLRRGVGVRLRRPVRRRHPARMPAARPGDQGERPAARSPS